MKSTELRQKFLKFFEERGHKVLPSASLVPAETDPSVLFNTAGMHPLVPYLLGEKHSLGKRLVNVQKCIRTDDIDEVGDKVHHTFFEMLGNWSLGDYFKSDAIKFSFELLTGKDNLNIPIEKIAVSVFEGDEDAPFDQESYDIWFGLGLKPERIAKLPKKNNWWGPAGQTGPCGPDTEMFVWTGETDAPSNFQETKSDPRWVEVWNDVFMQYEKTTAENGFKFIKLAQHNVDTGMGMERALAVMDGVDDNYKTELFWPIIIEIEKLSGKKYDDFQVEFRIIADHIKAATFAISDGAIPSNKGAGYVVRRLIRRAIVKAREIGIEDNFTVEIAEAVFKTYEGIYFNGAIPASDPSPLRGEARWGEETHTANSTPPPAPPRRGGGQPEDDKQRMILIELEKEEIKFRKTLKDGLRVLSLIKDITAKDLFNLYQSYGLPVEITIEEAKKSGREINNEAIEQYNNLMRQHQELSRTASAGLFKGGLVESGEMTTKYHTATHLLLVALRKLVSADIYQKGSNITAERLRLDFNYGQKLTQEQIKLLEDLVNEKIKEDLPVEMKEMSLDEAKKSGAMGIFDSKYGDKVKVYSIGSSTPAGRSGSREFFSREICGGPHVTNTGDLGHFKITKEESSSSGVRRIKAILE